MKSYIQRFPNLFLAILLCAVTFLAILPGCGDFSSEGDDAKGIFSGMIGTIGDGPANLGKGVEAFSKGDFDKAGAEFGNVVSSNSSAEATRAAAQAGLGWISLKKGNPLNASGHFKVSAKYSVDAAVGLSITAADFPDSSIDHIVLPALEEIGMKDVKRQIAFSIPHGVNEAQARGMMAFYYAMVGDLDSARNQITRARELNSGDAASFSPLLTILGVVQ